MFDDPGVETWSDLVLRGCIVLVAGGFIVGAAIFGGMSKPPLVEVCPQDRPLYSVGTIYTLKDKNGSFRVRVEGHEYVARIGKLCEIVRRM